MAAENIATTWPTPAAGGQYTQDPKTGALTRTADETPAKAPVPAEKTAKE